MLEILGKTSIDFMGKRKYAFLFSGVMVLLGIVTLIQIGRGSANLGIDFAGGTAVQLQFEQPVQLDEARALLERGVVKAAQKIYVSLAHTEEDIRQTVQAFTAAFGAVAEQRP